MPNARRALTSAFTTARHRLAVNDGKIVQRAVAAAHAWLLAGLLLRQPQTVFAPFAAIVVLLGGYGGRGVRGVQVAVGVGVGVLVGEGLVGLLDRGPLSVALGSGVAMLLVALLYTDNLPIIQAGIAAGIVVTADSPASGAGRLLAALLGVAVALLFSQVLFTPSPTRVLQEATDAVLAECGRLLDEADDPQRRGPPGPHDDLTGALCTLAAARGRARSIGRFTLRGRRRRALIGELDARAGRLAGLAEDVLAVRRAPEHPGRPREVDELRSSVRSLAARPHLLLSESSIRTSPMRGQ